MARPLRILCVYHREEVLGRPTVDQHLYSLRRYADGCSTYYLNTCVGVPRWLSSLSFDVVVFHYLLMAMKWSRPGWERLLRRCAPLRDVAGYRVAIHQDEYVNTALVGDFLREFSVKTVVTCLPPSEWRKVYPFDRTGVEHFIEVAPGYVDETTLSELQATAPVPRDIDLGYRARRVPFWLGRHGQLKGAIADRLLALEGSPLRLDVSTDPRDVFVGRDWYRFLARCRAVAGCEGGASLLDPDGALRERVDAFVATRPTATFDEVERACFPGLDGNLKLFAASPRHFEAAMTRTAQVLIEGHYQGLLVPDRHYIPLRADFSNLSDVLAQVGDRARCEAVAERAFADLVASGRYTYRRFVETLLEHVLRVAPPGAASRPRWWESPLLRALEARHAHEARYLGPVAGVRRLEDELTTPDGRPSWPAVAARLHGTALRAAARVLRRDVRRG